MKPSNDLEVALCAAVDRGDLESYLHTLRTATVVMPAEGQQLGPGTAGWPVTMVDGMAQVPVFTSPEALLADPERRNGSYTELTLPDLAKMWPDPAWRLAVNPGLSTAVYLPGTYALSTGFRLGAVNPTDALQIPDIQMDGFQDIRTGAFATENQAEQDLLQAITAGDPELALRALLDSTLFIVSTEKDGYTLPGQPGFRWLTISMQQGDALPVFTSRSRVDQGMRPNTYTKLPISLLDLSDAWPDDELALVVNPGTSLTVRLPGPGVLGLTGLAEKLGVRRDGGDFQPGAAPDQAKLDAAALALSLHYTPGASIDSPEQAEHALLEAAAQGDRAGFLKILFGIQNGLRLGVERENDPGLRYSGRSFPWETTVIGDRTVLQAFTSSQLQRQVTGWGSRSSADFDNLLRYWPDANWDLAINPGTPIGAVLSADQIAALSEWYDQWFAHELAGNFPAPPQTERIDLQLLDASRRGDRVGFLEILRPAKVLVATDKKDVAASNPAPTDPEFPWDPVSVRGRPSMPVYTGRYWQSHTAGSDKSIRAVFGDLAAAWPEGGPDLLLNPASPVSITMTAEEVRAFGG